MIGNSNLKAGVRSVAVDGRELVRAYEILHSNTRGFPHLLTLDKCPATEQVWNRTMDSHSPWSLFLFAARPFLSLWHSALGHAGH